MGEAGNTAIWVDDEGCVPAGAAGARSFPGFVVESPIEFGIRETVVLPTLDELLSPVGANTSKCLSDRFATRLEQVRTVGREVWAAAGAAVI